MGTVSLKSVAISLALMSSVLGVSSVANATSSNVRILRAARIPMSYQGLEWSEYSYTIAVKNLAYDKQVEVIGRKEDGTWTGLAASYVGPLGDGYERWDLYTQTALTQFAIKYQVQGLTYWDNNDGHDYTIDGTGVNLYNDVNILQWEARRSGMGANITISVNLQNIAYTKSVYVVYTADNWRTVSVAPLHYNSTQPFVTRFADSPNQAGVEYWSGELYIGAPIEYAISYDVAGTTYWDNNYGANYRL